MCYSGCKKKKKKTTSTLRGPEFHLSVKGVRQKAVPDGVSAAAALVDGRLIWDAVWTRSTSSLSSVQSTLRKSVGRLSTCFRASILFTTPPCYKQSSGWKAIRRWQRVFESWITKNNCVGIIGKCWHIQMYSLLFIKKNTWKKLLCNCENIYTEIIYFSP